MFAILSNIFQALLPTTFAQLYPPKPIKGFFGHVYPMTSPKGICGASTITAIVCCLTSTLRTMLAKLLAYLPTKGQLSKSLTIVFSWVITALALRLAIHLANYHFRRNRISTSLRFSKKAAVVWWISIILLLEVVGQYAHQLGLHDTGISIWALKHIWTNHFWRCFGIISVISMGISVWFLYVVVVLFVIKKLIQLLGTCLFSAKVRGMSREELEECRKTSSSWQEARI